MEQVSATLDEKVHDEDYVSQVCWICYKHVAVYWFRHGIYVCSPCIKRNKK